jgi:hypothetical protein
MGAEFQIMGLDRFAFRQWLAPQLTPMAGQAAATPWRWRRPTAAE